MIQELILPDTAGQAVTIGGDAYTLAENIHFTLPDADNSPIEPRAQVVAPPGAEIYWLFDSLGEVSAWEMQGDISTHVQGILTLDDICEED